MHPKENVIHSMFFFLSINIFWLAACGPTPPSPTMAVTLRSTEILEITDTPKPIALKEATITPKSVTQIIGLTNTPQAITPTVIPTPSEKVVPTDTIVPTALAFDFNELLSVAGIPFSQPGAPPIFPPCQISVSGALKQGLPAIIYESTEFGEWLCIFGFPIGETVNISIFNPNGNLVDSMRVPVKMQYNGIGFVSISFIVTLDLPTGDWRVVASTDSMRSEAHISFGTDSKLIISLSHLLSPPSISPTDPRRTVGYQQGEIIVVQGINFPPDIDLPVGIYKNEHSGITNKLILINGKLYRTTQDGTFKILFKLDGLGFGAYTVVTFQDINQLDKIERQLHNSFMIDLNAEIEKWILMNNSMALGDDMQPNEILYPGHAISSENEKYRLVYEINGNLVLYKAGNWMPLWKSNTTESQAGMCIMQNDGNLVIYDHEGKPIWASNTSNETGSWLIIQNDGNVVIYRPSDKTPIWSTNTVQP